MDEPTFTTVVEHLVFFQLKPETKRRQAAAMVTAIKELENSCLQLNVGPLSESTAGMFDYAMYSRHASRSSLRKFLTSTEYKACQENVIEAACEDVLEINWDSEVPCGLADPDVTAIHSTLFKLKMGMETLSKEIVIHDLTKLVGSLEGVSQIGLGRIHSHEKGEVDTEEWGYHWAFVLTAKGPGELTSGIQSQKVISWKEQLAPFVAEHIVVDFIDSGPATT
eukprot:TRINITY_DN13013_c0_g2_i1.p1 TRINITY_DN13013_c0_g2~~TRINITY_DN13013_c0_g2_i1.p1  ORF type:complete len:223 (-),score=34.61 TRINITY_DN13013_c0_g2_i1:172-840(-)